MIIVQIILHQTVESGATSENSFFYDFTIDFILPVLLAVLAAFMAYWISIKETKRDKRKEEVAEMQQQKDN